MLTAVVSGDKAVIFANVFDYAQSVARENDDQISLSNSGYMKTLDILSGRRISRTITLSREN
jgi:hypothetical protein